MHLGAVGDWLAPGAYPQLRACDAIKRATTLWPNEAMWWPIMAQLAFTSYSCSVAFYSEREVRRQAAIPRSFPPPPMRAWKLERLWEAACQV